MEIIADYEIDGRIYTVYKKNDFYHVSVEDRGVSHVVQPNHDAEGIIRYLSHTIMGLASKKS